MPRETTSRSKLNGRVHAAAPFVSAIVALLLAASPSAAQQAPFAAGAWTRGLMGAWGHSWKTGVPGWGKTTSHIRFVAFHPQLGFCVTDRLELYGEGSLLWFYRPERAWAGGLVGVAGRYHFRNDRGWSPYITGGAGLLWTSLDVPEFDRLFNFQLLYGIGVRFAARTGPGWMVEIRNHHVSNAGTAGENLGTNAATIVAGMQWVLQ